MALTSKGSYPVGRAGETAWTKKSQDLGETSDSSEKRNGPAKDEKRWNGERRNERGI